MQSKILVSSKACLWLRVIETTNPRDVYEESYDMTSRTRWALETHHVLDVAAWCGVPGVSLTPNYCCISIAA